jgi:hypothetical protein
MKYLLMGYVDERALAGATPEQQQASIGAHVAYVQALKEAGVLLTNNRLTPSAKGATVRMKDGKSQVLDGPYAESKEQFGGYWLIEAPDMDAALSWAARCPVAQHGVMEVRQVWAPPS